MLISPYWRGGWRRRRRRGRTERPKNGVREHCTANCNEAVVSRLGAHPCTMRSSDAMRAVERAKPSCQLFWCRSCLALHACAQLAATSSATRCDARRREERRAREERGEEAKKQAARAARRRPPPPPPPRRGLAAPLTTPPLPSPSPPGPAASLPHVRQPWRVPSRSCCFAQQPPASPRRTSGKLLGLCIHHGGLSSERVGR